MNQPKLLLTALISAIALLASACSSAPVTQTEMTIPQQTVQTARVVDPGLENENVRTYIRHAEERIKLAKASVEEEEFETARLHLIHAQGYAEVALELARNNNELDQLSQTRQEIEMVQDAIDNS